MSTARIQIMVVDRTHLLVAVPENLMRPEEVERLQYAIASWRESDEGALVISSAEIVWPEGRVEVDIELPPTHTNPAKYCTACGGRAGECDD